MDKVRMEPDQPSPNMALTRFSELQMPILIEALLDIRDLLKPEITGAPIEDEKVELPEEIDDDYSSLKDLLVLAIKTINAIIRYLKSKE